MKGWRTIIFNIVMAAVAILNQFGAFGADTPIPTAEAVNQSLDLVEVLFTAFWGLGNVGLRTITTTAVGRSS